MLKELDDYDWAEAFGYAGEPDREGQAKIRPAFPTGSYVLTPFSREDVEEICAMRAGEHDEESWLIYGRLKDGRWFSLEVGCDYTGWDCQAGGDATIANSKDEIERFGLTDEARDAFNIKGVRLVQ